MTQEQETLKINVLKLYHSGVKAADIVKHTGVPRSTVYYWIKSDVPEKVAPVNLRDYHFLKQKCERQEKMIEILKTAPCTATAPLHDRMDAIEHMVCQEYNVNTLCETLNVAKGTYYNHILRGKRGQTYDVKRREELFPIIEKLFHENHQIYGAGKIAAIMRQRGIAVCESTVASIMHEHNLFSVRGGAKKLHYMNLERKRNLLNQNFTVTKPNEVWVSDVTYYTYNEKTYYICVIIDLYARKVISWRISMKNSTQLTKGTLRAAYAERSPIPGLIFHSDNGGNYVSATFRKYVAAHETIQSFSRPHNPYDNSVCESFFNNLKQEELYRKNYRSERELFQCIAEYMVFYNETRPHSMIYYHTPNKFEASYYEKKKVQENLDNVVSE